MGGRRVSYFDRYSTAGINRLDELVSMQRGVVGRRVHMVASACYPFDSVLKALAEPSFVLPAEGAPGRRYLPGAAVMDEVELSSQDLCLDLFGRPPDYRVTIQPHSGTQANQVVYNAVLRPGDKVLCLGPRDGGHISHSVLLSRRNQAVHYGLTSAAAIDYDHMRALALEHRPRLIIVGGSSLPRSVDFAACGEIARESGAFLHADISHTATFVAAGLHSPSFPHCDFATFNVVKNLRGPNGGVLVFRSAFETSIESALFPGTQGGANESGMLGKLACFLEWQRRDLSAYATAVVAAARELGGRLKEHGIELITDGTDCHMLLLDLRLQNRSGADVERHLESLGVLANRNLVPGDRRSPSETSGLRLGATNLAILGYEPADLRLLADWLAQAVEMGDVKDDVVEYLVTKYQAHLVAPVW